MPTNSIDAIKHRNPNRINSGRVDEIACHARRGAATRMNIDAPKIARSLPVKSHAKGESPRTAAFTLALYTADPAQRDPIKTNTDKGTRKKTAKSVAG
jgi:hypothetical protein